MTTINPDDVGATASPQPAGGPTDLSRQGVSAKGAHQARGRLSQSFRACAKYTLAAFARGVGFGMAALVALLILKACGGA